MPSKDSSSASALHRLNFLKMSFLKKSKKNCAVCVQFRKRFVSVMMRSQLPICSRFADFVKGF